MERRRTAPRLALLLAAAAVPAMAVAGCSSSSGSGSDGGAKESASSSSNTSKTPATPAAVKYAKLPDACRSATKATVTALVPRAKSAAGTPEKSDDVNARSTCSWTGNGADGFQYRWLSVTLQRFDSSTALGSGEDQARSRYVTQVTTLGHAPGVTATPLTGYGDQATSLGGKATVAKITTQNDTLLARSGNVVVIVEYNGAGFEGKKNPTAQTVQSGAERAAKDALAAVVAANA